METRVVFGMQFEAPKQVSRTNTCRNPLFAVAVAVLAVAVAGAFVPPVLEAGALLLVTATNATNRPVELIDGRIPSVPFSAPPVSVEINVVSALHVDAAPAQVSRTYTCLPVPAPSTKFVAAELNATYLPSALIAGM
jgi:hypothetical protein